MGTSSEKPGESPTPPEKSTVILLLGDIGDTTWRMFIPTIGCAMVGVYFDRQWNSAPWCMLVGAVLGAAVAGYLIKQQLQRINQR